MLVQVHVHVIMVVQYLWCLLLVTTTSVSQEIMLVAIANILYTSDPLWDGSNCRSYEAPCCTAPGLPWFHRNYSSTTTDYIELRVCGDYSGEDSPVSFYEIYVK